MMITHEDVLKEIRTAKQADAASEDKLCARALCIYAEYFAKQLDVRREELKYLYLVAGALIASMVEFDEKAIMLGNCIMEGIDSEDEERFLNIIADIFKFEEKDKDDTSAED